MAITTLLTADCRKIVPPTSARLNLGNREEWFNIVGADHHGVCKFAAEDNAGYMMVRGSLSKQVAKLSCMLNPGLSLGVLAMRRG